MIPLLPSSLLHLLPLSSLPLPPQLSGSLHPLLPPSSLPLPQQLASPLLPLLPSSLLPQLVLVQLVLAQRRQVWAPLLEVQQLLAALQLASLQLVSPHLYYVYDFFLEFFINYISLIMGTRRTMQPVTHVCTMPRGQLFP